MGAKGIVLAPDGSRANIDPFYKFKLPTEDDLPNEWSRNLMSPTVGAYYNSKKKLRVLAEIQTIQGSSGEWLHVSYWHKNRVPNHATTTLVKELFIGDNREAIAVFPPKSRYVNVHPYCLHLWSPLDPRDRRWPKFEKYVEGAGSAI